MELGHCKAAPQYRHVVVYFEVGANNSAASRTMVEAVAMAPGVQSIGLVHFASGVCDNEWLKPFLLSRLNSKARFLYMVHGWSTEFETARPALSRLPPVLHWPLGPNYSRGARHGDAALAADVAGPSKLRRPYLCNFIGSLHKYVRARHDVVAMLTDPTHAAWQCHVKWREHYQPTDSAESADEYALVVAASDFTLCPAGSNAESYRIYEAMSMGSVPVLQRSVNSSNMYPGYHCEYAYENLKDMRAPVVWLDNWSQLPAVMERLRAESPYQTYRRRWGADGMHAL